MTHIDTPKTSVTTASFRRAIEERIFEIEHEMMKITHKRLHTNHECPICGGVVSSGITHTCTEHGPFSPDPWIATHTDGKTSYEASWWPEGPGGRDDDGELIEGDA